MSWIDDNKDSGPWPFTEQPDVWGYLNNPKWSNHPKGAADSMSASEFCEGKGIALDSEETHKPCGHWHKRRLIFTTIPAPNLYGCGSNSYGEIGIEPSTIGYITYTQIMTNSSFTQIAAGWYFSFAIKDDGTLWSTGENYKGQLGHNDQTARIEWEQVGTDSDWAFVACGRDSAYAIKTDGTLYSCGENGYGQLGLGNTVDRDEFEKVGTDTDWVQVACGRGHMVALKSTGILWGTGYNGSGELGLGPGINSVNTMTVLTGTGWTKVVCGEYVTMGVQSNNTLWGTGYNYNAMLGLGDWNKRDVFTQIPGSTWEDVACGLDHTIAIKTNGTLWSVGYNDFGQLGLGDTSDEILFQQVGSAINWAFVYAGCDCSGVINDDSELWVAGECSYGEHGFGDYKNIRSTFEKVDGEWDHVSYGWNHSLAMNTDSLAFAAGWNVYGAIGIGESSIFKLTLVNQSTWNAVDTWGRHTLAIKDDGTVWGSGRNQHAQLGLGEPTEVSGYLRYALVQLPVGDGWEQVACGANHSVILKDGVIWGCGLNFWGNLGTGGGSTRETEFKQIDDSDWAFIAAGGNCSMAIKENGLLYSTGHNSGAGIGQLGLGDSTNRYSFTECIGTGWKQVSIGSCHAGAVRSDGTLWTTGKNIQGQLGLGDNTQRLIWTQVSGSDWDYVECGYEFTLAVKTDGALYATGSNSNGQLGLNDKTNRNTFVKISDGWLHDSYDGLAQFSGGSLHSMAIYGDDTAYGGGEGSAGRLGSGVETDTETLVQTVDSVPLDGEQDYWDFIVSGSSHTMALKIVSGTELTTYNDDDEPQVWPM